MSFAQLCTEDGATLWHANQADNIDEGQLRELAYQWNDVKQAKLNKISWPDASHLASMLLYEDPASELNYGVGIEDLWMSSRYYCS